MTEPPPRAATGGLPLDRAVGVVLLVTSGITVAIFLVEPGSGSIYDASRWTLLWALTLIGLALVVVPGDRAAIGLAAAGAVVAGQLSSSGIVGYRHWSAYCGPGACNMRLIDIERPLAVALAVTAFVAFASCLAVLVRVSAFGDERSGRVRAACVAIGFAVIVALPFALEFGRPSYTDLTTLGATVLLYSAPWGLTLAAAPFLRRRAALAAIAAVLVSSVATLMARPAMAFVGHRWAFVIGVGAALAVLAVTARRRPAGAG